MKNEEKETMCREWLQYAKDDLESAEIILNRSDNYHISVYHSHQAIEKTFKWFLLKNDQKFPFIHDIKELFGLVCGIKNLEKFLKDISFIDDLYPRLRYPTGEETTKAEAEKSLKIAKKITSLLNLDQ